jgi:beta-N-acetylhexosaminidase
MHSRKFAVIGIIFLVLAGGTTSWLCASGYFKPRTQQSAPPVTQKPVRENRVACINALPMNVKIGQKLMVAGYSNQLSRDASVFNTSYIGGIIIMNQASSAQLATFRSLQLIAPFIATDQEGGSVQRYTQEGTLPGATDMASSFSPTQAYNQYLKDDQYLKNIGITTNFAPVVGVISASPNSLPGRMYSSNPSTVATYAAEAIKASKIAGITPVIKHFPGLGSASGNTDLGSAITDSLAALRLRDIPPYTQLAKLSPDAMVSNVIVPDLTDGQPASWSPAAVALLRHEGYQQSVVYSDSLTAKAIPGQLNDAVIKAWQAGIDVALIVQIEDQTPELTSYFHTIVISTTVALQSGKLNNNEFTASINRILTRKQIDPCQLLTKFNG